MDSRAFASIVGASLALSFFAPQVKASDAKGVSYGFGVNGASCAEYVAVRGTETSVRNGQRGKVSQLFTQPYMEFAHYTEGWLSATNQHLPDHMNVLPSSLEAGMRWLENYCRQNPLASYGIALSFLLQELYPRRQR